MFFIFLYELFINKIIGCTCSIRYLNEILKIGEKVFMNLYKSQSDFISFFNHIEFKIAHFADVNHF